MLNLLRIVFSIPVGVVLTLAVAAQAADQPSKLIEWRMNRTLAAANDFSPTANSTATVDSRGALVAQTRRDIQANSTIGRTVAVNPPSSGVAGVQFSYIHRTLDYDYNRWGYNAWDAGPGAFKFPGGTAVVQSSGPATEAGAYPKICVGSDGRAWLAGYDWPNYIDNPLGLNLHLVYDASMMGGLFGNIYSGSRMDTAIERQGSFNHSNSVIWPTMDIYQSNGNTYTYLAAFENNSTGSYGTMKVFSKIWDSGIWSLVFVDTAFYPSQDISCNPVSGEVAVVWTKYTAAGLSLADQRDADVWYATWSGGSAPWTRVNLTQYTGAGYRAAYEVSSLYDHEGYLHIIWNAAVNDGTPGGSSWGDCQLFHWTERVPGQFHTVHNAEWDILAVPCWGGPPNLNIGRFSIGECQNRLYVVFAAFNDRALYQTVDCSPDVSSTYAANGEIYVTASTDLSGSTWGKPRNMSNSPTPGCLTGNCADDRWACISRRGLDDNLFGSETVWPPDATWDPSGTYTGSEYISVMYVTDKLPGIASPTGGAYTDNDVRWVRLACYDPTNTTSQAPALERSPSWIDFPEHVTTGQESDFTISLHNSGATTLNILSTYASEESTPGVPSGWLGYSGVPASIGPGGTSSMTVRINQGGIVVTPNVMLNGVVGIVFSGPDVSLLDTIYVGIEVKVVSPTDPYPVCQTISSGCMAVSVSSNGGAGSVSGVSAMNFLPPTECDTGSNSRGNAGVYLVHSTPVVFRNFGSLVGSFSMFELEYPGTTGFFILKDRAQPQFTNTSKYQSFFTGSMVTRDSQVIVERTWYIPKDADSCNFVIQKTIYFPRVISSPVTNLTFGEVFDWDIPTDVREADNTAGYSSTDRMVWFRGYHSLAPGGDCADNSRRYGGNAYLWSAFKDGVKDSTSFSAYYQDLDSVRDDSPVYTLNKTKLYSYMSTAGTPSRTDYRRLDLYGAFRVRSTGMTLPANDTLTVWTVMASVMDADAPVAVNSPRSGPSFAVAIDDLHDAIAKAKAWSKNVTVTSCCIGTTGNVNKGATENPDLSDLSLLIAYLTVTPKPTLPCLAEANINASVAPNPDLSDLSLLIAYLTVTPKPTLPNCP